MKGVILRIIRLFISLSIFSLLAGCKQTALEIRSDFTDNFSSVISQIDKETYNEIDWLTEEPTGGVIVYDSYKLADVDNDGIDELFVIRKYVNNQERYIRDVNQLSSIGDYNKFAIRQGFISESYRIVNGNIEPLIIENEMVSTQAFQGGHFGVYYFLLNDGKIVKFYNSYWNETLIIYNNSLQETIITYDGDMETGEWQWKIDGVKTSKENSSRVIKQYINIQDK